MYLTEAMRRKADTMREKSGQAPLTVHLSGTDGQLLCEVSPAQSWTVARDRVTCPACREAFARFAPAPDLVRL